MTETKTVFISGAGRNIGRSIAIDMAMHGHNVLVNGSRDRDAAESVAAEARSHGVEALVAMGSVGSGADCARMAQEALAQFGTVDMLVNNAAIRPSKPFLEMTDEDWHSVMDVDLNGAFYLSRALLPGMVEKGWGRIVNMTGMNAIHGYSGRAPVSASKHAVWGLTKALSKEFASKGITVNAISPGPIEPDGADEEMAHHIQSQLTRIPAGRLGRPEEIAGLTRFLCSDEGAFISGQMIACNGGTET